MDTSMYAGMGAGMPQKTEPMPDLLTRAFNEAVRPYTEKIEHLEGQIAELNAWIESLEQQRAEVHSWIDKRGLRPGTLPVKRAASANMYPHHHAQANCL